MYHTIVKYPPHDAPLPIPHLLQFPDYCEPGQYIAIVPSEEEFSIGDGIYFSRNPIGGPDITVAVVLERRPAKGDWSKQAIHKNPDYIRFMAK